MKRRRYLVSQDLWALFAGWAKEFGFKIPGKAYFDRLSQGIAADLQCVFDKACQSVKVKLITFNQLRKGMKVKLQKEDNNLVVSLDRVYFAGDFQLEINRTVCKKNGKWNDLGENNRPGFESIEKQFDLIGLKTNGNRVILIDEGCWSGESILRVVRGLGNRNVWVNKVCVGIYIDRGGFVLDIPFEFAYRFPAETIVDWICERDFLPGAPLGGRTVVSASDEQADHNRSYGAYYLFGMGDYVNWASLEMEEDLVKWFTSRRIIDAVSLFEIIEYFSDKIVLMKDLSRLPYGVNFNFQERFVDVLKRQI